jgi:hypothetical protein
VADRRRSSRTDNRATAKRIEKASRKDKPLDLRWWREDEPHEAVWSQVRRISRSTGARAKQDVFYACLYDDAELGALLHGSQAIGEWTPQTMTTNLVKRQVDAFVAKLSKNRPVPMALTNGGTYGEQRRAKSLSKFFEGVLDQVGYWQTRPMLLRDGAVFGSGLAHNYRVGKKLHHERVFPWEIRIDPRESQYGKPRTMYVLRYVDRLVLMERFPKHAALIADAEARFDDAAWDIGYDETSDLVLVVESWHLPDGETTDKDSKNGAHAICVSNATLVIEDYKRDYFPFSKFDFSPGIAGWWGTGLAQQLEGLQFEANSIGLRLQEQGWMTGTYVWTPPGVGFEIDHLDNGTMSHIESEVQPVFHNPPPWHPQFFDYYLFLRGRAAAEETRLSEMAVRGEKPAGLDSGKAIRAWNNLDDEAFLPQGRADEQLAIDTSWQLFDLAEEILDEEGSFKVRTERREYGESVLEDMDFKKVHMDREKFTLRVFPTSMLKGTPAENYQTVREWMADGLISQDEVYSLLDLPDVQRVLNLRGAARRAVEKILQDILDSSDPESVYVYPEPPMNLELCRALALQVFLDAFTKDADQENLDWVLQFALDAEAQLEGAVAQPGEVDPNAAATEQMMAEQEAAMAMGDPAMAGDPTFLPPEQQPVPGGAVAPEAMAPIPGM